MDITMCKGTDCPSKNECFRCLATPDDQWQSYFIDLPFDFNKKSCKKFIQYEPKSDGIIEHKAMEVTEIIERVIKKHKINKTTFDRIVYMIEQKGVFLSKENKKIIKKRKKKSKEDISTIDNTNLKPACEFKPIFDPFFKPSKEIVKDLDHIIADSKPKWKTNVLDLSGECES